jgi:hypothetical protein
MIQEDYDSDTIKKAIPWFTLKKNDFDIISNYTVEGSRLFVEFGLTSKRQGVMKASKDNCKELSAIFIKYIYPNYINRE